MKKKKYSQLRKEIKNLNIAEGTVLLVGGAAFIATCLYLKVQGLENYSALEQYFALLPSVLSLPITTEIFSKIKNKVKDKQEKLFYDNQSTKQDYLKAYYKKMCKKILSEKEVDSLFDFTEFNHARLNKNLSWFYSYELALKKGQSVGVSAVTKFPNEDINDDSFVYSNEKIKTDSIIQDNIKIIKEKFNDECPYAEFNIITPRNDISNKKFKKVCFGFTNMEQVCEFEKQLKKIQNKIKKTMSKKIHQEPLDNESETNQVSSNQEINM